jgi:hypothetical protein
LQAALADIAERIRRNPNWSAGMDRTYGGLDPSRLERMTEAEFAAYQLEQVTKYPWMSRPYPPVPSVERPAESEPSPPRVNRACLPFGQRVRKLRRALGWTQRQAGVHLGAARAQSSGMTKAAPVRCNPRRCGRCGGWSQPMRRNSSPMMPFWTRASDPEAIASCMLSSSYSKAGRSRSWC